jgi:hypothetical protein
MEDKLKLENEAEEHKKGKEERLKDFFSGIGYVNLSTAK